MEALDAFAWDLGHPWAYPALEVVHILGIGILLGNLLLFELRVWGVARELPLPALARVSLPLALLGFVLAVTSGVAMFLGQPAELVANRAFVIKMALLALAGGNAAFFHARGGTDRIDPLARGCTALSLLLWVAAIACGRFIAYV